MWQFWRSDSPLSPSCVIAVCSNHHWLACIAFFPELILSRFYSCVEPLKSLFCCLVLRRWLRIKRERNSLTDPSRSIANGSSVHPGTCLQPLAKHFPPLPQSSLPTRGATQGHPEEGSEGLFLSLHVLWMCCGRADHLRVPCIWGKFSGLNPMEGSWAPVLLPESLGLSLVPPNHYLLCKWQLLVQLPFNKCSTDGAWYPAAPLGGSTVGQSFWRSPERAKQTATILWALSPLYFHTRQERPSQDAGCSLQGCCGCRVSSIKRSTFLWFYGL